VLATAEGSRSFQPRNPRPPQSSRTGPKTPVLAMGGSSSQAGGRLKGWSWFFTPANPRVARAGDRLNRVRACW